MKVGVRAHFDSMHSLPAHPKCGTPHGHTYTVEVSVEGPVKNGMVIDFADLKKALHDVVDPLDHDNLNKVIEYPSSENICSYILEKIRAKIEQKKVVVRVWEGDGKWAELEG